MFVVAEDGQDAQGKPKLKAVQTFVEAGDRFDGRVAIERGIAAGDLVVASGQLKLQNGAPVTVASDGLVPPATAPVE